MNQLTDKEATKVCSRCKEEKPLSGFVKDKTRKDGLTYWCKFCLKKAANKNKDKLFQEHKQYQLENPLDKKTCYYCEKEKSMIEFFKDKDSKDGFGYKCRDCRKQHYIEHKKQINLERRKHYSENKEEMHFKNKQHRFFHKEGISLRKKRHYLKHKDKIKLRVKKHRLAHREEINLKQNKHNLEHREERSLKRKQHHLKNKEKDNLKSRQYTKQKRKTDMCFRISCNLRGRVKDALKGYCKSAHTEALIMCPVVELKLHIERLWLPGMTWVNWGNGAGKWNIDHIIPCAFFNMLDPVEQYMCFRWQNMQPLWWEDNARKGKKVCIL